MPLCDIDLAVGDTDLPESARMLLRDGEFRAKLLQDCCDAPPGFVPCQFPRVARAVQTMVKQQLAQGTTFCEWGSGLGVVAGLAALFGFGCNAVPICCAIAFGCCETAC